MVDPVPWGNPEPAKWLRFQLSPAGFSSSGHRRSPPSWDWSSPQPSGTAKISYPSSSASTAMRTTTSRRGVHRRERHAAAAGGHDTPSAASAGTGRGTVSHTALAAASTLPPGPSSADPAVSLRPSRPPGQAITRHWSPAAGSTARPAVMRPSRMAWLVVADHGEPLRQPLDEGAVGKQLQLPAQMGNPARVEQQRRASTRRRIGDAARGRGAVPDPRPHPSRLAPPAGAVKEQHGVGHDDDDPGDPRPAAADRRHAPASNRPERPVRCGTTQHGR